MRRDSDYFFERAGRCTLTARFRDRRGVRAQVSRSDERGNIMSGSTIGRVLCVAMLSIVSLAFGADDAKPADAAAAGTTELFNGKDLTGWGYKTGETFDGKTESD